MAQRQLFRIDDFTGGLNLDQSPLTIAESEAAELSNFRLDKLGSLVSRHGLTKVHKSGDFIAFGRHESKNQPYDSRILVATTDSLGLINSENSSNYWEILGPGEDRYSKVNFLSSEGYTFIATGVRPLAYFNDTRITRSPDHTPQALTATGNGTNTPGMTGVWYYAVTAYDSATGFESAPVFSAKMTATNENTILLSIPTWSAGSINPTHLRFYRTTTGGAVYQRLAQVAYGGETTAYNDSTADSGLGVALELSRAPALAYEHIAYYKGYYFGSIGRTLYWSEPGNAFWWPVFNSTEVPFEGEDSITGLVTFQDTLLIFSARNTVLLAGSGGNWQLARQDVDVGCLSSESIVELDSGVVFLSSQGLFSFPGFQEVAPKLNRRIASAAYLDKVDAAGVSVPEERAVWMTIADTTYVVHLLNGALSSYTFAAKSFLAGGATGFGEPWLLDKNQTGITSYSGALDYGEEIQALYKSKIFQLPNPEKTKHFRRIGAFATQGADGVVTITIADRVGEFSVLMRGIGQGGITRWDKFNWDEGYWSDEGIGYFIGSLPAGTIRQQALVGMTVQVTITASCDRETEVVPPITLEFRESDRFMGG